MAVQEKCKVRKCMVLVSPTTNVCQGCVEELLKHSGSFVIGSEVSCWNCHNTFKMDMVDLDKSESPLDDMSILRDQNGTIHEYAKPQDVKQIEVEKIYIDATQWGMQQALNFIMAKGFNIPANQRIDEGKGMYYFYKGQDENLDGWCFVPLVPGIVLQLDTA